MPPIRTASEEKGQIKYMTHERWDALHKGQITASNYTRQRLQAFGKPLASLLRKLDHRFELISKAGIPLVWRKHGPGDWLVVLETDFETDPWFDGRLWGVTAATCDRMDNGQYRWRTGFWPYRSYRHFATSMREHFRYPYTEAGTHSLDHTFRGYWPIWEPKWPLLRSKR